MVKKLKSNGGVYTKKLRGHSKDKDGEIVELTLEEKVKQGIIVLSSNQKVENDRIMQREIMQRKTENANLVCIAHL